jgi:transmembrane sensor
MRSDQWAGRTADRAGWTAEDWLLAERSSMDESERREFNAWLAVPENADAYFAAGALVQELRELADPAIDVDALVQTARSDAEEDRGTAISHLDPARPRPQARRMPSWIYAVAATVAAAAIALLWFVPQRAPPAAEQITVAHYATGHADRTTRRLPDGSVLQLDADSSVTLRFTGADRSLDLERGQAVFEVVHDASRPFHVIAGAAEIVDVGTTFSVSLHDESTVVTVVEGHVRVGLATRPTANTIQPGTIPTAGSAPAASDAVELAAGDQVRVAAASLPDRATQVDVGAATAWAQGRIVFDREPLTRVVEQFNRYAPAPITIVTPELGERKISGSFQATDTESFVAYLRTLKGVRVESSPVGVRVSRR